MITLIVPFMHTIGRRHYKTCTMPVTCVAGHFMHYVSMSGSDSQESQNLPLPYHQESHPLPLPCHQYFRSIHLPARPPPSGSRTMSVLPRHPHPTLHLQCHHIRITSRHMMCPHHRVRVVLASDHVAPPIAILHLLLHMIGALRSRQ